MKKRLFYAALMVVVLTGGIRAEGDAPILDKREDPPVIEQPVEQKEITDNETEGDEDIYDGDWIGNPFEIFDTEEDEPDDTIVNPDIPDIPDTDDGDTKGETGNFDNYDGGEIDFDEEYRKLLEGGEGDKGDVNEIPYIPAPSNNDYDTPDDNDNFLDVPEVKEEDKLLEHFVSERKDKVIILNVDGKIYNTGIYVEETDPELVAEALRQMSVFNGVKVYKDRNVFLLEKDGKTQLISVKSWEDIAKEYDGYKDKTQFPKNTGLKDAFPFLSTKNLQITVGKALTDGSYKMKNALSVYGNIPIKANGVIVEDDYTSPLVKDDVVLYPIRTVGEALGCEVSWSDPNFMATLKKGDKRLDIRPGDKKVTVTTGNVTNTYELSATPEFKDGRTMVPVALICNVFEGRMYYDDIDRALVINNKDYKDDKNTQGGSVLVTSEASRDANFKKPAFSDEEEPKTAEPNVDETDETIDEPIEEPDMDNSNIDSDINVDKEKSSSFDIFNILTEMVKSKFE